MEDEQKEPKPASNVNEANEKRAVDGKSLHVKNKVIQPVSDMSEFVGQTASTPSQPAPKPVISSSVPKSTPTNQTNTETNTDSIYPEVLDHVAPSLAPAKQSPQLRNSKVIELVPELKPYAIFILVVGLLFLLATISWLSLFNTLELFTSAKTKQSSSLHVASFAIFAIFAIAAVYIGLGLYFLNAKKIRNVNTILSVLLVLNIIGLLDTLANSLNKFSSFSSGNLISLSISIGLVVWLWNVKSQVSSAVTS